MLSIAVWFRLRLYFWSGVWFSSGFEFWIWVWIQVHILARSGLDELPLARNAECKSDFKQKEVRAQLAHARYGL